MQRDTQFFDLLEACAETGCPVCRLSLMTARRYLADILYEFVNDPGIRDGIRHARGYCNEHAWWMANDRVHQLGIALIQQDMVETILAATEPLRNGRNARQSAQELLKRLQPTAECPVCAHVRTMEDIVLCALLKYIGDPDLAAALENSDGLCLAHFSRALELMNDADTLKRLMALQRNTLTRLRDELAEFIRKNDYRFRDEEFGKEGDSWRRAIGIVSSGRGVRHLHCAQAQV